MYAIPAASFAQISVGIAVHIAPPVLPVYVQQICPGDGYIWTPGYWAYGDDDYYWVPGTWVLAPGSAFFGRPVIGVGAAAISGTLATGDRTSDFMGVSTMALVTSELAISADAGMVATSPTIAR